MLANVTDADAGKSLELPEPFYDQVDPSQRDDFAFEDLAGIYTEQGKISPSLCALHSLSGCGQPENPPGQDMLCADCTEEENREEILGLMQTARERYRAVTLRCSSSWSPEFCSGIIRLGYTWGGKMRNRQGLQISPAVLFLGEHILSTPHKGADKVFRRVLPAGAGGNAVVRDLPAASS